MSVDIIVVYSTVYVRDQGSESKTQTLLTLFSLPNLQSVYFIAVTYDYFVFSLAIQVSENEIQCEQKTRIQSFLC